MSSARRGTFVRREPAQYHSLNEPLSVNPVWETSRTNTLTGSVSTSVARAASAAREASPRNAATFSPNAAHRASSAARRSPSDGAVRARSSLDNISKLPDDAHPSLSDDDEQPRLRPAADEVPVRTLNFVAPESLYRPSASRSPLHDARDRLSANVGSLKPQAALDDSTLDAFDGDTTSALSEEQGVNGTALGGDYPASPTVVVTSALRYMVEPFPANREPVELSLESSWHDDFDDDNDEPSRAPHGGRGDSLHATNGLRDGESRRDEFSPGGNNTAAASAVAASFSRSQPRRTALDLVCPAPVIERSPRPQRTFSIEDDEGEMAFSSVLPIHLSVRRAGEGNVEALRASIPRKVFPSPIQLIERSCRELPVAVVSRQPLNGLFHTTSAVGDSRNVSPGDFFDEPREGLPVKPHPRPTSAAKALNGTVEQFLESTARLLGRVAPEGQPGGTSPVQHPRVVARGPALGTVSSVRVAAVASHATVQPSAKTALASRTSAATTSPKSAPSPVRAAATTSTVSQQGDAVRTLEVDDRSPVPAVAPDDCRNSSSTPATRNLHGAEPPPVSATRNAFAGDEESEGEAVRSTTSPLQPQRGDAPRMVGRRSLRDRVLEKKHKKGELSHSVERRGGASATRLERDDRSDRSLGSIRASPLSAVNKRGGGDAAPAVADFQLPSSDADLRSKYVTAKRTSSGSSRKRDPLPLHPKPQQREPSTVPSDRSKPHASRNSSTPVELATMSSSMGSRAPTPLLETNVVAHKPSEATLSATPRVAPSNEPSTRQQPASESRRGVAAHASEEAGLTFVSGGNGSVPREPSVANSESRSAVEDASAPVVVREASLTRYQSAGRLSVPRPATASPPRADTPPPSSQSFHSPSGARGDAPDREETASGEPQPKQRDTASNLAEFRASGTLRVERDPSPGPSAGRTSDPAPATVSTDDTSIEFSASGHQRLGRPSYRSAGNLIILRRSSSVASDSASFGVPSAQNDTSSAAPALREESPARDPAATADNAIGTTQQLQFHSSGHQALGREDSYRSAGNLSVLRRSSSVALDSTVFGVPSAPNDASSAAPALREESLAGGAAATSTAAADNRSTTTQELLFHSSGHQALGREQSYRSGGNLSVPRRSSSAPAQDRKLVLPRVSTPPPPPPREEEAQVSAARPSTTDVTRTPRPTSSSAVTGTSVRRSKHSANPDLELQATAGPPPPRIRPRLRNILADGAL